MIPHILIEELFVLDAFGFHWIPKEHAVSPAQFPPASQDANVYSNIREAQGSGWYIFSLSHGVCQSKKTLDTMEMQCWRLHLGMIEKRLHSESGWTSWAGCVESAWPVQDCKYIYIDTLKITHQDPSFGCVWHRSHLIAAVCTRNHKWNLNIPKIHHSCQVMLKKLPLNL